MTAGGTFIRAAARAGQAHARDAGDFDVIGIVAVDRRSRLGLLHRVSQEPDAALSLPGQARRDRPGASFARRSKGHARLSDCRPMRKWAIDRFSAFDTIPTTAWSDCPAHEQVRMLADNKALRAKLEKLENGHSEFFRVDIGDGVVA